MIKPFGRAVLLAGAAALLAPVGAFAQDVRNLDNARSDVMIFNGEVGTVPAVFRYTMQPGTSLRVDVVPTEGSELDPMLTITDRRTGEVLAEDDDGGEGLASRATIRAPQRREIEISITSFAFFSGEESSGPFELQLRPSTWTPLQTERLGFGSQASGRVGTGETRYYEVSGTAGQLLEVALVADDDVIDPTLALYSGDNVDGDPLVTDDDGGNGLNSLLRFVLPETGTYTIAVSPYGDSAGRYTLHVGAPRDHEIQSPQQVLGLSDRASGYLGAGYEEGALDPATITYQLTPEAIAAIRGGAGEVTFNMTAPVSEDTVFPSTVDPWLELGFETPLGFAGMMQDDDGGEGLNARIALDLTSLARDGDWLERLRVRASSISGGGAYEIELVEGMQPVSEAYSWDETEADWPLDE
jgi:hypothetical protein